MKKLLVIIIMGIVLSLLGQRSYAQAIVKVKGLVRDTVSETPSMDADIFLKRNNKLIATTDVDGRFSIDVPVGTIIVIRQVGRKDLSYRIKDASDSSVILHLEKSKSSIEEVVVTTGFTKVKRELNAGATQTLLGKDIQNVPATNISSLLQGRFAGLNIQNSNGLPGARVSMFSRGLSSAGVVGSGASSFMTPTSPLFIVDGIQVDDNANYQYGFDQAGPGISPLSAIPVEDVESIEYLKDASATAIYGSKAAYGVIIITTKRGKSSVPVIDYTTSFYINGIPKLRDVIGGRSERDLRIQQIFQFDTSYSHALALINDAPFLADSLNPYYNNSTNWQDYVYRNTPNQTHNINISGGSQTFSYKVNLGYLGQSGIVRNTGLDRYTLNMNTLYQPSDKIRFTAAINSSVVRNKKGSGVGLLNPSLDSAQRKSSLYPSPDSYSSDNDVLSVIAVKDNNKTVIINSNLDFQWKFMKNLMLDINPSYSFQSSTSDQLVPGYVNSGVPRKNGYNGRNYGLMDRNILSWTNSYNNEMHSFNVQVFNELSKTQINNTSSVTRGLANDDISGPVGYNPLNSYSVTADNSDVRTLAYGTQFMYNFDRKYILNFTFRTDGTSVQGADAGWTRNPTVAGRWNFNKEKWFEKWTWLDFGALRYSWGRTIIPMGTIYDVYGTYTIGSGYNNSPSIVNSWKNVPNNNFKPKVVTQNDIGFEFGAWGGKLNVTYDFYYKIVENDTRLNPIADINGFSNLLTNDISQVNYGHELSVILRPLSDKSKFNWTLTFNGAINRNVLTHLPGDQRQMIINYGTNSTTDYYPVLNRIGRNVYTNLLYNTKGVYATDDDIPVNPATGEPMKVVNNGVATYLKAGDPRWADLNGDYIIDTTDRVAVGDPFPRVTGGITSNLIYKNFTLDINMSYTLKRDIINTVLAQNMAYYASPTNLSVLVPLDKYNYWTKPGDNAKYPNPFDFLNSKAIQPFRRNQTLYMEDGSYLKINSITLSYNLNRQFTQRFGVTSCRVYATVANLATFSKYSGTSAENVTDLGYDISLYPNSRTYTIGASIRF
ncbi:MULTISPECIES: SusC/RagA family TonB-linked outer membrane protein [Chitinophagaceae]